MLPPQLDEAQRCVVYHPRQQVEGHTVHVRAETIEHRDYLPGAALPRPPAPVVAPEIEEQLCFLLVAEYRQHPPSLVLHTQGLQLTGFVPHYQPLRPTRKCHRRFRPLRRLVRHPFDLQHLLLSSLGQLNPQRAGGGVTRLRASPDSESHIVPACITCARRWVSPGQSSSVLSSTAVLSTSWVSSTNPLRARCCSRAASKSSPFSQLKFTQSERPSRPPSATSHSTSCIRSPGSPLSEIKRSLPSPSSRATSRPLRPNSARSSSSECIPSTSRWYFTSVPPLASPTRKKAASNRCISWRFWEIAITLSGTSRKARS